MKRILVAALALAVSACASGSGPFGPSGPPSGFAEEQMASGRYRINYTAPSETSSKVVADRTMARAAQLTLDKGNEWFEIASKIDGKNSQTLVIVMGKGETLVGGPRQYDAKTTLASLKGRIG